MPSGGIKPFTYSSKNPNQVEPLAISTPSPVKILQLLKISMLSQLIADKSINHQYGNHEFKIRLN